MSNTFRQKNICKKKRLTGELDFSDPEFSARHGNKRKWMQKEKVRKRKSRRRSENKLDDSSF